MRVLLPTIVFVFAVSLIGGACAFAKAPMQPADSPALVKLGYELFEDPALSRDGSMRCSGCHVPSHAFSDGRPVSVGVDKHLGTRNTPSLLDVTEGEPLFWDGRHDQLKIAVLDPLTNVVEMGNADLRSVIARLRSSPHYRTRFAAAFPNQQPAVSKEHLGQALAAYIRSLPRSSSAYDRFEEGDKSALAAQARQGLALFLGKAQCSSCHDPAQGRFTDDKFHHSGVGLDDVNQLGRLATQAMQRNLPIASLGSAVGSNKQLASLGRFLVSHRAEDVGAFRTPSLRNVAMTAPYMHDGSISTLEAAVDTEIYYRGLATGRPISLTLEERADLVAFLKSLTETSSPAKGSKQTQIH